MSSLGFMSDKLDRLEGRLESLVGDATVLQAESLQLMAKFGFTPERVVQARTNTGGFVRAILDGLVTPPAPSSDCAPIVDAIKVSNTPLSDWTEDLKSLSERLQAGSSANEKDIETIRQILDLLRREVIACSNRIRKR
jgi:hypothetical protein